MTPRHLQKGFSLIEILVSVGIVSLVLVLMSSFILQLNFTSAKTKADREALASAQRAMDVIAYEIRGAQSVYVPTTTASQLSLQTTRYLPTDETSTFIDFFLCGSAICLKKESQSPVVITADSVNVSVLQFTYVLNGSAASVKINMTVNYNNPDNNPKNVATVNLVTTVGLRTY